MRAGTTAKPTDTEIRAERRGGAVRVEGRGDGGIAKRAGAWRWRGGHGLERSASQSSSYGHAMELTMFMKINCV
ncbi:unnamed protein product [Urochloa humidicola]